MPLLRPSLWPFGSERGVFPGANRFLHADDFDRYYVYRKQHLLNIKWQQGLLTEHPNNAHESRFASKPAAKKGNDNEIDYCSCETFQTG